MANCLIAWMMYCSKPSRHLQRSKWLNLWWKILLACNSRIEWFVKEPKPPAATGGFFMRYCRLRLATSATRTWWEMGISPNNVPVVSSALYAGKKRKRIIRLLGVPPVLDLRLDGSTHEYVLLEHLELVGLEGELADGVVDFHGVLAGQTSGAIVARRMLHAGQHALDR